MTQADRLECPLLRCRKRFPNHELMLRHLYTCEQLSTGEYWCYECDRTEKFTDGKCKRCLGHPGKRRRIMSVAKNFFSSLGQKSRPQQDVPDLDMDDVVILPPPSYDSILVQPQEVELSSSSEILEIDSTEIPLPMPSTAFAPGSTFDQKPSNPFATGSVPTQQSMPALPDLNFEWGLQNGVDMTDMGRVDRPSLSVHTHGLSQYRKQHKPTMRTKDLSPSASLRSNASTDSTASYLVSPASAFSGAWTHAETSLTSPTSDSISPGGNLSRGCSNASQYSNASRYTNYDLQLHTLIQELPAEDIMLPQTLPDDIAYNQQFPLTEAPNASAPGTESSIPTAVEQAEEMPPTEMEAEVLGRAYSVDANSLVGSAWELLKAHVSSSMEKLQCLSHNHLVRDLQSLSPQRVADIGLTCLKRILEGGQPASTIEALCFVHVTYSLSLIVHEDDAQNRSKQLFVQAHLYSNIFRPGDREAYLEVATEIWHPLDLSTTELDELLLERYQGSVSRSSSPKGKGRASPHRFQFGQDSFLEIAQFFLDELEVTALPSNVPESKEVLASTLWSKHLEDDATPANPAFTITVNAVTRMLCQEFPHARRLESKMQRLQKRISGGSARTVRRAELELMQVGKGCMSVQEYFDNYVPEVRERFGALYSQPIPGYAARSEYHAHGIELMRSIICGLCEKQASTKPVHDSSQAATDGNLDEFIRNMTNDLDGSLGDFMVPDDFGIPNVQVSMDAATLSDPLTAFYDSGEDPALDILQPLTTTGNKTADNSPGSAQTAKASSSSKGEVQANDCCEICGYRPKGDPQWFKGSMAKHKKLQHSAAPPKIYRCPYPGCTSQYKNRPDNLKQHQQDKGHFVEGDTSVRRPSKRKKTSD
ncbi:hypothetical protein K456DRAFT_1718728 [Colletotrichum gloeosporioides 23]|nr:hypothetical protein K456DRAFT_1718728 [Colletotrichum gloeosporioides 23]KAJ0283060.1 hypothetical protein COL940_004801 [Colletotrichum noveboracense]KAJ0294375.1 hypothetical protein CBS470a_000666 [Colletotrichum nupharicola]KAJ0324584.1 hypothetical protein Brms1b_000804 [Colletotrichum noveboracense]